MQLLTFSNPRNNKSILLNVDDSKDRFVLIKPTSLSQLILDINSILTVSQVT